MQQRKGIATVEFAVLLPVFVLLTLGMLEVSRYLHTFQRATQGAREGARFAAGTDEGPEVVKEKVQETFWGKEYSDIPASDREKVGIEVSIPEMAGGATVVKVYCNYEDFSPFPPFYAKTLETQSVFRREP